MFVLNNIVILKVLLPFFSVTQITCSVCYLWFTQFREDGFIKARIKSSRWEAISVPVLIIWSCENFVKKKWFKIVLKLFISILIAIQFSCLKQRFYPSISSVRSGRHWDFSPHTKCFLLCHSVFFFFMSRTAG